MLIEIRYEILGGREGRVFLSRRKFRGLPFFFYRPHAVGGSYGPMSGLIEVGDWNVRKMTSMMVVRESNDERSYSNIGLFRSVSVISAGA